MRSQASESLEPVGCFAHRVFDIKGIDEDMKLNKALWKMAEVLRNGGAQ
jgi:hypothetical protein